MSIQLVLFVPDVNPHNHLQGLYPQIAPSFYVCTARFMLWSTVKAGTCEYDFKLYLYCSSLLFNPNYSLCFEVSEKAFKSLSCGGGYMLYIHSQTELQRIFYQSNSWLTEKGLFMYSFLDKNRIRYTSIHWNDYRSDASIIVFTSDTCLQKAFMKIRFKKVFWMEYNLLQ